MTLRSSCLPESTGLPRFESVCGMRWIGIRINSQMSAVEEFDSLPPSFLQLRLGFFVALDTQFHLLVLIPHDLHLFCPVIEILEVLVPVATVTGVSRRVNIKHTKHAASLYAARVAFHSPPTYQF